MSHVTCHKCGSNEHHVGYGLACGPIGGYTVCECGELLEFAPDLDGVEPDEAAKIQKQVDDWRSTLPEGGPEQ